MVFYSNTYTGTRPSRGSLEEFRFLANQEVSLIESSYKFSENIILRPRHSLFFPGSLFAYFLSMDRYRSIAHFADVQVHSSLSKQPVVRSWKRALKRSIAPKTTVVCSYVCMYSVLYRYIGTVIWPNFGNGV